jgi:hypothetical protein
MAFAFSAAPDPKKVVQQAETFCNARREEYVRVAAVHEIAVSDLIMLFNEAASDDPMAAKVMCVETLMEFLDTSPRIVLNMKRFMNRSSDVSGLYECIHAEDETAATIADVLFIMCVIHDASLRPSDPTAAFVAIESLLGLYTAPVVVQPVVVEEPSKKRSRDDDDDNVASKCAKTLSDASTHDEISK